MNTEYFYNNGIKLAYFNRYSPKSKVGVIIIHGLAEHKGRYKEFIELLNKNKISVFAIDLCGHGESHGKRGDIGDFQDYVNDLDAFTRHVKKQYPNLKLALFGHSIGGLIAANYASKSDLIDMLILSSPSLNSPKILHLLKFFPTAILRKIYIRKRHSESKEMLSYSRQDPLSCHYFTLGLLKNVFISGINTTKKNLHMIKIPTLVLGGQYDPLVNSNKFKSLLKEFGSYDKTLKIYKNTKHRIVQNEAKEQSIPDIINWLNIKG